MNRLGRFLRTEDHASVGDHIVHDSRHNLRSPRQLTSRLAWIRLRLLRRHRRLRDLWQQAWRSGVKVDRNLLGVFGVGLLAVQVALELPSNRPGSRMIGVLCGVRVSSWVTTFFVLSGSTSRSARTWSTIAESICLRPAAYPASRALKHRLLMFRGMPSLCPEILSRALVSEQLWSCITRSSKSVLDVSNDFLTRKRLQATEDRYALSKLRQVSA